MNATKKPLKKPKKRKTARVLVVTCPYCQGTDVTSALGRWECFNCGQECSY